MKISKISKYIRNIRPPYLQQNGHLQTIVPAIFRKANTTKYFRERIQTADNDFLDLDWIRSNEENLVIICHGLEGNSSRPYITGMANFFHGQGWSTLAWNFRGCSEEINRQLIFYHSGSTNDLQTIINHVRTSCQFQKLFLLGFSLGGNLILKYLGEQGAGLPGNIFKAVCFSVPLNLHQSCERISRGVNRIYSHRFLKKLKKKVLQKAKKYPDNFDLKSLGEVRRLIDFDDRFTAPLHGFENAIDYYQRCSSINYLEDITIPTLIVNARNDPFLSGSCFPVDKLANHDFVELLTPSNGGHCGFADREFKNGYWSEVLAWNYLNWV